MKSYQFSLLPTGRMQHKRNLGVTAAHFNDMHGNSFGRMQHRRNLGVTAAHFNDMHGNSFLKKIIQFQIFCIDHQEFTKFLCNQC